MNRLLLTLVTACVVLGLAGTVTAQTADLSGSDRSLAPYFKVLGSDTSIEQLPLKSTSADVKIAGVIADVTVTQVYRNTGDTPIEAVYVFPASTRAAVHGLTMTIGDRVIRAVVRKREEARREYEVARQEGRSASLLEEERPNVFTMSVANIMPGDEIKVEMKYTELLVPTEGVYEFVYPTVVGPRYSSRPATNVAPRDSFVASPYTRSGEAPRYDFGLRLSISAGMPIQRIECATHKVIVAHDDLARARVTLDPSETNGGNRDFILRYRLAGAEVEPGLLLYQGARENFFLLTVQPPERVDARMIPAREYIFVVDVSGSMHGFPIETEKKLLRDIVLGMRPKDSFNIVTFASGSRLLAEQSLPATETNVAIAARFLDQEQGGGGTELLAALERAMALPRVEGVARSVIIATDGYVDVEKEAFDLIGRHLDKTSVFAFGIGSSVNRYIIEGLARVGQGEPFIVEDAAKAADVADRFREYIKAPVFTGIRLNIAGFDAYDVSPQSVPDVFASRPIVLTGKWRGAAAGRITLTGWAGSRKRSRTVDVGQFTPSAENAAIGRLWARNEIARLDDYNNIRRDDTCVAQVTQLGLDYNLLTAYTSFVAVDQVIRRNERGEIVRVDQALPMPQGVENSAVGCDFDVISGITRSSSHGLLGRTAILEALVLIGLIVVMAGSRRLRLQRSR